MKTLKVILTVFLTILLVVIGFVTEIVAIVNLTVLNPWFYNTALRQLGLYENLYTVVIDQLNNNIVSQEVIPEEYKEDVYALVENALPKKKFEVQVGEFLGDTIDFILYGKDDGEIPVQEWMDSLKNEISDSDLLNKVDDMEHILNVTLVNYFNRFNFSAEGSVKISDVIFNYFAPSDQIKQKFDDMLWVIRFWVRWVHTGVYIAITAMVLILGLLFVIWHKTVSVVFKLSGILLIINSVGYILSGGAMFMSITIMRLLGKIPESYAYYSNIAQTAVNPIAMITLGFGIILLALGITLTIIGRAISKNTKENIVVQVDDNNNTSSPNAVQDIIVEKLTEDTTEKENMIDNTTGQEND